jgi:large subunit ribosomal protein L24
MAKVNIKKNDQVLVTAGKNAGVRAKVLKVLPDKDGAIVERVNMIKRHTRPNPQKGIQGGVLEKEAPIRLSNLMVVCPTCGKATRIGRRVSPEGGSVRICKKCGATL